MVWLRLFAIFLGVLPSFAWAAITTAAGPYRVSMEAQPAIIPIGRATLTFRIQDASGKPLEDLEVRAMARMPGMFMGEREQRANPVPGIAGAYSMQAAFPMAGAYDVDLKIQGSLGSASGVLKVSTGQDTGSQAGGFSLGQVVPWLLGVALLVFVVIRMRATGQRADWRAVFNRGTLAGVFLLGGLMAIALFAVNNLRRQGAMTPIEAQVMEMNTPAPPGATAVELATVKRGPLVETVRYSGQAVGFVEQDVNPRVTGVVMSMPVYVGDRVKKGQVLARLDTSQLDPQLAERAAMTNMAAEGVGVAAAEYQAALQEVAEARSEVAVRESGVLEAQAMLEAARQERAAMEADVAAMQTEVASAQAEVSAADGNARFRTDELARMRQLYAQKAVSRSELQQAEAEAADAQAALRRARSMVQGAESKVAASRANVRKAESMVAAAQKRVSQSQAEVRAARAAVVSKQRAADAAKRMISRERAAVDQARAGYRSAAAQKGYAELKAEVDGVVTQRIISPGTLVNPGQTVLKVAQVSPIRLQANVAAPDLERIRQGGYASIRSRDSAGAAIRARITSVSPALDPQSRTGVVEILWPNANGRFQPGQFLTMDIEVGRAEDVFQVPSAAIQRPPSAPGDSKKFVYVASPAGERGRFTVKRVEVQTGISDGSQVSILSGLSEGQRVVVRGGAYLRDGGEVTAASEPVAAKGPVVEVYASGYKPEHVAAEAGKPLTITFIRREEEGCGQEIMFPEKGIKKPLPLNKPVEVTLTPEKPGEIRFTCGMDMYRGRVVVR